MLQRSLDTFETEWATFEGKIRLAPGKELLKRVLTSLKDNHKVSISPLAIAGALRREEIPDEIESILQSIEALFSH